LPEQAKRYLLKSTPIATDGVETDGRCDTEQAVRAAVRWGGPGADSARDRRGKSTVAIEDRATSMPGAEVDQCTGRARADQRPGGAAAAHSALLCFLEAALL